MHNRVALAVFALLILAVTAGWFTAPESAPADYPAYAVVTEDTSAGASGAESTGLTGLIGCMVLGAAAIGLVFFRPYTPKGPRRGGAPSDVRHVAVLLVERARRGLADRHQELEVVLGLLQTVDQQIDRLVRVQARQYAAQLVQYGRLVRAQQ
ncbi:hypothetical protein DFR74_11422 [Nocardia puris]|uniref:Uncharacterized protein n=1 Tax=Nocardia puris TaxID=208602 RepID=A0A366D610_9NOCA|nr:hypothetical protein DFR74_11422 [Nocardia puris]